MRISDWSSDVCSSDLLQAIVEKLRIGRRLRRVARIANVEADIGIEADIAQCTADLFFAPDKDRMAKPRIAEGDRKSVVSGKSVSVRVELGGRRINKKTNERNLKTKHIRKKSKK